MSEYSISFSARLASGIATIGMPVVIGDSGTYVHSTAANRTALGSRRTTGLARTESTDSDTAFDIQHAGVFPASLSGLGVGTNAYVIVTDAGTLERSATPGAGDDVIGFCDTVGNILLFPGISAAGSPVGTVGPSIENNGTGQLDDIVSTVAGVPVNSVIFTGANPDLRGMDAFATTTSRIVALISLGGTLTIRHQNPTSSPTNRFRCGPSTQDLVVIEGHYALAVYDTIFQRWQLFSIPTPSISRALQANNNANGLQGLEGFLRWAAATLGIADTSHMDYGSELGTYPSVGNHRLERKGTSGYAYKYWLAANTTEGDIPLVSTYRNPSLLELLLGGTYESASDGRQALNLAIFADFFLLRADETAEYGNGYNTNRRRRIATTTTNASGANILSDTLASFTTDRIEMVIIGDGSGTGRVWTFEIPCSPAGEMDASDLNPIRDDAYGVAAPGWSIPSVYFSGGALKVDVTATGTVSWTIVYDKVVGGA